MAVITYKDQIGVSEFSTSYEEGLRLIGKQDKDGKTVTICYIKGHALRFFPFVLKLVILVFLLSIFFIRQPLGWIPLLQNEPDFMGAMREWDLFSWPTWIASIVVYLVYLFVSTVRSGFFPGLPGSEIHFARHRKIVKTIRAGERALILDWRIAPFAVVSTKPIAVEMPAVEGNTRDNISLTYNGALILRVTDSYRLLVEGGMEKFIQQLKRSYESIIKDQIIGIEAKNFNRFLIEAVHTSQSRKEDVSKKLELLGKTDLTIEFLNQLTEIDEVDVSSFDLSEPELPPRRSILDGLRGLADTYGIEIIDHLPLGNSTSEAYLRSLALPLANSITRIEQSTDTLKEITEEEIGEEILANVADKQIGVLEVQKIIKEIESITSALQDPGNEHSIVQSKRIAMENMLQSVLAPRISAIESLIAQVQAKVIDTAGLERYMSEVEELLDWIEDELPRLAPEISEVMVEQFNAESLLPEIDIVDRMLESTGTQKAFDALRSQAEKQADYDLIEQEISAIEARAESTRVEEAMEETRRALASVAPDSGVSTEEYSTENVKLKIDEIAKRADVEVGIED